MTKLNHSSLNNVAHKNNQKILWLYGFVFFSIFAVIFNYNIAIQQVPNFNYQVLPTGQWEIIDNAHPTMTKDTVITAVEINKKNYHLDRSWLTESFYHVISKDDQRQVFINEKLLYQASKTHTINPIKLIDSEGQVHNFELKKYSINDIKTHTWILYGLGFLKFSIVFLILRVAKINVNTLIFLFLTSLLGLHCFYSVSALNRVWAVNPEMLYCRLTVVNLLFRLYYFTLFFIWLRAPNNLFQHFKFLKIFSMVLLVIIVSTWFIYFCLDIPSLDFDYTAMIFYPIIFTVIVGYIAIYLQWRFLHKASNTQAKFQVTTNQHTQQNNTFKVHRFNISKSLALRWMFVLVIMSESVSLYSTFLRYFGMIDRSHSLALVYIQSTITSIGIVALILHKHLYKIKDWWWQLWGGVFAFSSGNASLIMLSASSLGFSITTIVLSTIIALLSYFSIVYYFRVKYAKTEAELLTIAIPKLITINSQSLTMNDINHIWQDILTSIFQPKYIELMSNTTFFSISNDEHALKKVNYESTDVGVISNAGETMVMQAMDDNIFVLHYASNGLKLFSPNNLKKAQLLWSMVKQAHELTSAYNDGEIAERKRIACDLHDDIGGKLLYLSSQNGEYGDYARKTLKDLRTLTHALSNDNQTLSLIMADMRYQIRSYCDSTDIELIFDYQIDAVVADKIISAQASVNLICILNELTRNAVQNPSTTTLCITLIVDELSCSLFVENNGYITYPSEWKHGLGTVSTERRVNQLEGDIHWLAKDKGGVICRVKWLNSKMYL